MEELNFSLQDFSIIKNKLNRIQNQFSLSNSQNAFYFLILDTFFKLQEDEIYESITDTNFLNSETSKSSGPDRGIDAIYLEELSEDKFIVHIFNFKYTENFDKCKNNFPSLEIDKIQSIIKNFFSQDPTLESSINKTLYQKLEEVRRLHDDGKSVEYKIYFCSNGYLPLIPEEDKRFSEFVKTNSKMSYHYLLMGNLINALLKKNQINVHAKIKLINTNFFETGSGDIRALVAQLDIRELLKCIVDDEEIRLKTNYDNYGFLLNSKILQDSFEDNVRMYLKQKTNINRSIKKTALNPLENGKIFYYNNGITITCSDFRYAQNMRSPILEIDDLQIVNGGQTIRALFDAYIEKPEIFSNVDILCKIYKTKDKKTSTKISEYTNSQNPVKSRDIRSIDLKQIKLEEEFKDLGYFYERKRNQYEDEDKKLRIDAEKAGQVILSFYSEKPSEAKNKKFIIFGDDYDNIFYESLTAQDVLIPLKIFEKIEEKKKEIMKSFDEESSSFIENYFIKYSSYYILYLLKKIADYKKIKISSENIQEIFANYDLAIKVTKRLIKYEKQKLKEKYNDAYYFKSNRLKENYQRLEDEIIKEFYAGED
jgi:hypothetical protein